MIHDYISSIFVVFDPRSFIWFSSMTRVFYLSRINLLTFIGNLFSLTVNDVHNVNRPSVMRLKGWTGAKIKKN